MYFYFKYFICVIIHFLKTDWHLLSNFAELQVWYTFSYWNDVKLLLTVYIIVHRCCYVVYTVCNFNILVLSECAIIR